MIQYSYISIYFIRKYCINNRVKNVLLINIYFRQKKLRTTTAVVIRNP